MKSVGAGGHQARQRARPQRIVIVAADGELTVSVPATSGKLFVPEAELVAGL